MPMPICNRFHESLANSGKITTFRGYHSLTPSGAGFLEPRKSRLGPLKSTFNAESFARSLPHWFRHNSLLKCVSQPKIAKKSIKPPILAFKVIQGH